MRILAGTYKGRKLLAPAGRQKTRPITASVKKSLFGMLGERLAGATVADLYCGTGTLGLEALSRGAERCFFAERDRDALARLRRNIEAVGAAERCAIWSGSITWHLAARLRGLERPLDAVFVDPPYAQSRTWSWTTACEKIFAPLREHLAAGGTVVLRVDGQVKLPREIGGLEICRLRRYGDMVLALLGRQETTA